jgi:hypothetical protein
LDNNTKFISALHYNGAGHKQQQHESLHDEDYRTFPNFAAGRIYTSLSFNSFIGQGYFNPFISDILKLFLYETEDQQQLKKSGFFQIELHPKFIGRTYFELFKSLLQQFKMVTIGLYRAKEVYYQQVVTNFVYFCPHQESILHQKDKVFVICNKMVLHEYNNIIMSTKEIQEGIKY